MTIIKILEPHPVLRFGLQQLLSDTLPDASVEALDHDFLYNADSSHMECDLVLLSILSHAQIPAQLDAVRRVCGPKFVLLLVEVDAIKPLTYPEHPIVRGVVRKDVTAELLQASVNLILAGGTCFPAQRNEGPGQKSPFSHYEPMMWPPSPRSTERESTVCEEAKMLGLTPRQYEVLVLLAEGHPLKTVGRRLNISVATAKAHTETLYRRLDVHNRNAAVYAAVSRGATLGWSNVTATRPEGRSGRF